MSEQGFEIRSHKGPYSVSFTDVPFEELRARLDDTAHLIVDARIAALYADRFGDILDHSSVLQIEATESNKSLDRFPGYVDHLVGHQLRRDHRLIAIGGGIIQDITCFLSATMLRGVDWIFFPTTLLAQADSCIGSKSSINCGAAKNILGTFTPPREIVISESFIQTLDSRDVRSGVGEILKVHAIEGPEAFQNLARDYDRVFEDPMVMRRYVSAALETKKRYIEEDEFDRGIRNVFNFGHSFGHAIEMATNYEVPHGIAVTIGMDMANFVAARIGVGTEGYFEACHPVLKKNYAGFEALEIPYAPFAAAIGKDKKNIGADLTLILPDKAGRPTKGRHVFDDAIAGVFAEYLQTGRAR